MTKNDLEYGNVVETRNGEKRVFNYFSTKEVLIGLDTEGFIFFDNYNDDLTLKSDKKEYKQFDIMKVYKDYTCKELLWERKEIKLTKTEKTILKNVNERFKYITRDVKGDLYLCTEKPDRITSVSQMGFLKVFNHLFQFIKWEDKKPYSIEELLKE